MKRRDALVHFLTGRDPVLARLKKAWPDVPPMKSETPITDPLPKVIKSPKSDKPVEYMPTAFSGADITVSVNGEVCHEITDVKIEQSLTQYEDEGFASFTPIRGTMVVTVFSGKRFKLKEENTLQLDMLNEYGHQRKVELTGVKFLKRDLAAGMNDIVLSEIYLFTARSLKDTPMGKKVKEWVS